MKKIKKKAEIRSNEHARCPFGLPIPFGCKSAGKLIDRMAPVDFFGEDASKEEKAEIAKANRRLLMWLLSEESSERCRYANKIFEEKDAVECGFNPDEAKGGALKGSPFYYKHFSGIGIDGLYSYPLGYYTDNSIDRSMYQGMYSLESPAAEALDKMEKIANKDLDEEKK